MELTQKSNLVAREELEQQVHMSSIKAFDFQISQKMTQIAKEDPGKKLDQI